MYFDIITTIILGIIWLAIYKLFPFLRRELWLTGLAGLLLLPFSIFIITDLREFSPIFSIIGTFFVFFTASLAGIVFHAIVGLDYDHIKEHRNKNRHHSDLWLIRFILLIIAFSWLTILFHLTFSLSNAVSVLISAIIISFYIVVDRKDLLLDAIISAFLMSFIAFTAGITAYMFVGSAESAFFDQELFMGLPIDLLLYSFALGLGLSPIYEYTRQYKLKTNDSR